MKILIATDGSPCSTHAVHEAVRLLPVATARVFVVSIAHVTPSESIGSGTGIALDARHATAEQHVKEAQAILSAAGVESRAIVKEGQPAEQLLAVARELEPDLLVLGSHGRGVLGRMILGSVSETVLRGSHGAVLVIRPR